MKSRQILLLCASGVLALTLMVSCSEFKNNDTSGDSGQASNLHPTAAWVLACRVEGQGFGCFPGDSAFTTRTGMALEILAELGALECITGKDELVRWLNSRQQPDGGFMEQSGYYHDKQMPWGSNSALEPTYWALRSFQLLNVEPDNPKSAAEFISARQDDNGGFTAYEYAFGAAPQALYTTFWAVGGLKILGEAVPDSSVVRQWVRSMQDTKGGRGGFSLSNGEWFFSSVAGCYYAMRLFDMLGGGPKQPERMREFLLSEYGQEPDGGFEVGHHKGWRQNHYSRVEDTYYGVLALELMGKPLNDLDSSRAKRPQSDCASWISCLQNPDGGFGRFGISEHTPLPSPSEMRSSMQAVIALKSLGAAYPQPVQTVEPVNEVVAHRPLNLHPCVNGDDPAEVWAFRRIALPIYEHFLSVTGSKMEALGRLNRWASAAVGPHNGAWITEGRGILMHGWGQCGTMSWLMQELATSVDHAARASFIIADVNCEVLLQEDGWDRAHWCLYVPFTHEHPNPLLVPPDNGVNGWSVLDMAVDYRLRGQDPSRPRPTRIADRLFSDVRVETIDPATGEFGGEIKLDSTSTYDSPGVSELYPDRSW
jgi:prenyltransferase beta subunit